MNIGYDSVAVLATDLLLSGGLAFVAIMLWSLTREPAWMLLIIGVILRFGEVVFQTLDHFGIITIAGMHIAGLPLFWLLLRGVPSIFMITGFIVMIRGLRIPHS